MLTVCKRRDAYRVCTSVVNPMTRRSMSLSNTKGERTTWTSSPTCLPASSTSWVGSSDGDRHLRKSGAAFPVPREGGAAALCSGRPLPAFPRAGRGRQAPHNALELAWLLPQERSCRTIDYGTSRLCALMEHCDLSEEVPTCPGWTAEDLAVHVDQAHRWAARIVRRSTPEVDRRPRRAGLVADRGSRALHRRAMGVRPGQSGVVLVGRPAIRLLGPPDGTRDGGTPGGRLSGDKPALHVEPELAGDTIDEWLELVSAPGPQQEDEEPRRYAGRALRLEATDAPESLTGDCLLTREDEGASWRRARARADVAPNGPLTELLLAFYRRLPPTPRRVSSETGRCSTSGWSSSASADTVRANYQTHAGT